MTLKKVVITGLGIVSSIGVGVDAVLKSLKEGKSGIKKSQDFVDRQMRSQVAGLVDIDLKEFIDRRALRFMGEAAAYSYIAMKEAISMAGLTEEDISNERTGLFTGSGGGDTKAIVDAADILREKGVKKIGPYAVPKAMSSTTSANLATAFKIKGASLSVSSACSTSAHCIELACDEIALGRHDIMFAGGGESADWTISCLFDAMGALSKGYNDTPEKASRPYDANRDGFVIGAGGGILVLESEEHAKARGANIIAEVVGFGATSDGYDMVAPSGEGAMRCMKRALEGCDYKIDYINTHGTSTVLGDLKELEAIREVFGDNCPPISSTKSMTGHLLGAAGAVEAIICVKAMQDNFLPATINYKTPDPECDLDVIPNEGRQVNNVEYVLSNSLGFGGHNAVLCFKKWQG